MAIFERRKNGSSKKWEFIYANEYAKDGTKFYLKKGKFYQIRYTKDKKEIYVDRKNRPLIRFRNPTLFNKYSNAKGSLTREVYLKPHQINVTDKMRKSRFINRYFVKYILDNENKIFEVSKGDFGRAGLLYEKISLNWIIAGNKTAVSRKNANTLERKNSKFEGIRSFLHPLQFYKTELTPNDVKKERIRKLIKQDSSKFTKRTSKKEKSSKLKTTNVAPSRSQSTTRTTSRTGTTGY